MVRKESADTQECESCQLNDMDENTENLSFIPSAVSGSAGWHELQFMCDRQCQQKGFKYYDIASVMVGDDGELHTTKLSRPCYNLRQGKRKESAVK